MKEKNHQSFVKMFFCGSCTQSIPKKYFWATRFDYFQLIISIKTFVHATKCPPSIILSKSETPRYLQKHQNLEMWRETPRYDLFSCNNFPQCVAAAKKLSEYVNPGFSYNFLHKYQDGKFDARLVLYTIFITNLTVMVLFLLDQYSFFCSCICIRFDFLQSTCELFIKIIDKVFRQI